MNPRVIATLAGSLGVAYTAAVRVAAQPAITVAPLVHQTFDTGPGGWTGVGDGTQVSITHEPENVKQGTGALLLVLT